MTSTRLHNDLNNVREHVIQSTFSGKYALNAPGNGTDLPFMEDPAIRLQKWGANMMNNTVNMESDLRGLTRKLNHDEPKQNCYIKNSAWAYFNNYPSQSSFTDDTRHSNPAWLLRDIEHIRWEHPIVNPQAVTMIEKQFYDNVQTRILEKDYYNARTLR